MENNNSSILDSLYTLRKNKGAMVALMVLTILIILAIFAPIITPHSPYKMFGDNLLQPPMWQQGGSSQFILGTDDIGRDLLSRIIYGARVSISMSFLCAIFSTIIGVFLGLLAGYYKGFVDMVIMRIVDILMAIPSLLLAMAIVAILGTNLINAIYAIAIVQIPSVIRITRSVTLGESIKDYVNYAHMSGGSVFRILIKSILPNCIAPILVSIALNVSSAILDIAALGFLGIGAQPPTAEWGSILSSSLKYMRDAWWLVFFPGIFILISVISLNILGDGIRDALDPKIKK